MKPFIALFALVSLTVSGGAAPRVWTSADGRQIEAEYLGRAADGSSLVLARADTGARVTVPASSLSAEDQAHAASLSRASAPEDENAKKAKRAEKLFELAKAYPQPPAVKHADFVEVVRRYEPILKALGSGDVAANCRALRLKIERDTPIIKEPLSITIKFEERELESGRKKQARQQAAQQAIVWLGSVSQHAAKIEAEAAK